MVRKIFWTIAFVLFIASCSNEKYVTKERPITAEFGQDASDAEKVSVVYLDLCGKTVVADEVASVVAGAELVLISADAQIGGLSAGEWLSANRTEWGHEVSYAVDGYIGSSSRPDAYFERMELVSGDCLVAEAGGYSFVIGDIADEDCQALISQTIQGGVSDSWIVIQQDRSTFLIDYTFTDCFAAQSGVQDDGTAQRQVYVYASQGVWSRMSYVTPDPVKFTVNIKQK